MGDLGFNAFISIFVSADEMQSDQNIIKFTQTELVLDSRELYLEERNSTVLKYLENLYREVHEALGAHATTAAQDAKDVVDFQIQLAKATEPKEKMMDRINQLHRMTLANMTARFPQFDWLRYVQRQFSQMGLSYNINLEEVVVNDALVYYTNLFKLVNQTSVRTLLNYGMWRFVHKFLDFLDPRLDKVRVIVSDTDSQSSERWKTCVKITELSFPYAVGRLYVDKKFSPNDKRRTEHMFEKLTVAFKEMLLEVTWMTQRTMEKALKKLNNLGNKIGYPDLILNDTALNAKSEMYIVEENNFFGNNLEITKKFRLSMLQKLRKPVDVTEWPLSPSTVNAFHSYQTNEIVFPAGVLSPPFYSRKLSDALMFGSIGFIIGHEITHGFDISGSTFDEKGNLNLWWTEEDFKIFQNRTQCLVNQFSQFVDKELNMHVNGWLTLHENIADNGGVKEAFRAYRSVIKERGREEDKYPSLPYTQDQLFFIGLAQVLCGKFSPSSRKLYLLSDSYSPDNFRVIGTLQNSEDFERVFKCPVGSPMNPRHKCQVW
ncbi:neprilysin-4-like [Pomacea canaliculata]|uniref:neprilysin-4-like n=1 Tax=Pomacea canaliculata TaxID=400727 RepID=UPI000D7394D8|nr:neprilysin-4-like [Pomacea canaliculata]